jgi:hypothetical protein
MFVACKLPNGLVISGAGKQCTLLGPNKAPDLPASMPGARPMKDLFGGYAITSGVDTALWEAWSKASADSEVIQNKLVFAEENLEVLKARAWSRNSVQSGFGPAAAGKWKM